MANLLEAELLTANAAVDRLQRTTAPNGLHYATLPQTATATNAPHTSAESLRQLVNTVPASLAKSLYATTYAFVPLALSGARLRGDAVGGSGGDPTFVADHITPELTERAICHRNAEVYGADYVFVSAALHNDSFALAFEFFINVAHDFVDVAGVPESFTGLLASQVATGVRGETSIDAWEHRTAAFGAPPEETPRSRPASPAAPTPSPADRERARSDYGNAAFADAVAIYLLAVFLDFDYADLREREYPLLAPPALAARLRAVHALYPTNDGYSFNILYRRRA